MTGDAHLLNKRLLRYAVETRGGLQRHIMLSLNPEL